MVFHIYFVNKPHEKIKTNTELTSVTCVAKTLFIAYSSVPYSSTVVQGRLKMHQ